MVDLRAFSLVLVSGLALSCGSSKTPKGGQGTGGTAGGGGSAGGSAGKGGSGKGGSGKGGSGATAGTGQGGEGGDGGDGGVQSAAGGGGEGAEAGDAGQGAQGGNGGTTAGSGGTTAGTSGSGGSGGTAGGSGTAGGAAGDDAGAAGSAGDGSNEPVPITFTVNTGANVHAISPLIYGVNPNAAACSDAGARFTFCRLGGNRWSTYNWETNASNAGYDLCFQNDGALAASDTPGVAVTDTVTAANTNGAATLVTLPILDYVAKDKLGGSAPPVCSGDVRETPDHLTTRFDANRARKGAALDAAPDTSDAFVNQDEFVAFLRDQPGDAHLLFGLDNQPGIWSITHAEVHPDPATYAEVVARNIEYATMVRDVWPQAEVSGYVGYGWNDFISLQDAPDAAANGEFIDYYLAEMKSASDADGRRLIDYLDVHWYSEVYAGPDRIVTGAVGDELTRLRVQAPRSLWDTTYVEPSWIAESYLAGSAIALIPRLKAKIATNFPETGIAISEWTYGGGSDVSGALATAEALGSFGREGVAAAAWTSSASAEPFALGAFRAFRNYDGAGAAFGDRSVAATSSDLERASLYASVDSGDPTRVVIIAINRSSRTLAATLNVTNAATFTSADVYRLDAASPLPVVAAPLAGTGNVFSDALPPYSLSVIVPKP